MIDLFGLRKQQEPGDAPSAPSTEGAEPAAPAPRGSHKLWAFLLVLDSVFVIVFAGAVAAKIYQHWKAPAVAVKPAPRKRPVKTAEVPAASTAPAPAPEAAKAPEPVEAKPPPDAPRPPKPSMTAEVPKHRETPKPADAGGKAAAAAPAEGKVKAVKTEFKVRAPKAKSVELVGAFIVRGGRKDMARQEDGSWTVTLYLNPGTYRYFFAVDKKKQLDPENPLSDKGASLLTVP
jgi:cytoskeletal protein RodZ